MFNEKLISATVVLTAFILISTPTNHYTSLSCFGFGGARHDGHQCIEPQDFEYVKHLFLHVEKHQLNFFILKKLEV